MNILIPTETCDSLFTLSRHCTEVIVSSLTDHYSFLPNSHFDTFLSVQSEHYHEKIASLEKKFDHLTNNLPSLQKRAVSRAKDSKISSWLNVLPIAKHHFDLLTENLGMHYQFAIGSLYSLSPPAVTVA